MNWYYESAGQQTGPVADAELDRLLAEGKITPDTLVWREGLAGWAPLRTARPAPAARESMPPIPPVSVPGAEAPPPGFIRCSLTGKYFPPSEIIYIEGRPYSAEAKPQVMQSLQAGTALPASEMGRTGPAWEQREQLGVVKAIIETVKAVLLEPTLTFSTMKRDGGLQNPLLFNLIVGSIGGILLNIVLTAGQMVVGIASGQQGSTGAVLAASFFGMIFSFITVPISVAIGSFIGPGILHLCLMLLKAAPRPFETTFRVVNYSNGALAALYLVPVIGWIAIIPWSIVVLVIGLSKAQEISTGKAALAIFLPMIVCCVLALLLSTVFAAVVGTAASRH
jgi:hypothetical protein